MGDKVGENPAALRAAVFLLSAKNRRGGVQTPPPAGRRLKAAYYIVGTQIMVIDRYKHVSYSF